MQGNNASQHWWQTRWFVLAAAMLSAVPLLWPTVPPLVDLPGHMGRYRVEIDIANHAWLANWYSFKWSLIGNLGLDLLIIPLSKIFGLELAVKLIVLTIPPLTVFGLLWIAREVHGRIPATALFALPLAYSFPFHFGFVNFVLSMALALNGFALWLRLARLGHFRLRAALFVPLSCLLWLCHTFGWGTLGVLAFSAEMVRQHDMGNRWGKAWVRACLGCLPLALPMGLMILWRQGSHVSGQTGDWFNWLAKTAWLTMVLRDRWQAFDIGSTAILYLILFRGFRDPNIEYSRNLGLSALFLLAVFLLLPRVVFGSAYADMRLVPFMLAIAIIAIRPKPAMTVRGMSALALAGLAFLGVRLAGTTASYYFYHQNFSRELAALDHVPQGARLLTLIGETCHNEWRMSRVEHLSGLALERKLAYSNDQWSQPGAQLMATTYFAARGFRHDPSQIVTATQCPREFWRPIARSLTSFPREAFDYVWVIMPPPYAPRLEAGLVPLWRRGSSALFKIDHDKQPARPDRRDITPPPRAGKAS